MVLTGWGGYGAGSSQMLIGGLFVVLSFILCCCQKQGCEGGWPCQCCGCEDCANLKVIFHMRNGMIVTLFLVIPGILAALTLGIIILVHGEEEQNSYCYDVKAYGNCKTCWKSQWTSHPHRRWEWGLAEMCWANEVDTSWQTSHPNWGKLSHEEQHFGCRWKGEHMDDDHDGFKARGPASVEECKALCRCMGGNFKYESHDPTIWGVVSLLNFVFSTAFAAVLFYACCVAKKVIADGGGLIASDVQRGIGATVGPPAFAQVVGQPAVLGQPVVGQAVVVNAQVSGGQEEDNQPK